MADETLAGDSTPDVLSELGRVRPDVVTLARVASLARKIEPYADRIAVSGEAIISGGPMALPLGMVELALGERDAARVHLERALATARRIGAEPFARRAEASLGELGDPA